MHPCLLKGENVKLMVINDGLNGGRFVDGQFNNPNLIELTKLQEPTEPGFDSTSLPVSSSSTINTERREAPPGRNGVVLTGRAHSHTMFTFFRSGDDLICSMAAMAYDSTGMGEHD